MRAYPGSDYARAAQHLQRVAVVPSNVPSNDSGDSRRSRCSRQYTAAGSILISNETLLPVTVGAAVGAAVGHVVRHVLVIALARRRLVAIVAR